MARGDDVPHPSGWRFQFAESKLEEAWREFCKQACGPAVQAYEQILSDPRRTNERQHRLKGSLGSGIHGGVVMEVWQYEITSGGRLWYLIDDGHKVLWLKTASIGHPKATERGKGKGYKRRPGRN